MRLQRQPLIEIIEGGIAAGELKAGVDPEFIAAQIDTLFDDLAIDAIKIGMLSRPEVIEVVARCLASRGAPNLVLDPVMVAKSGDRLLRDDAVVALREILLPMAAVVAGPEQIGKPAGVSARSQSLSRVADWAETIELRRRCP